MYRKTIFLVYIFSLKISNPLKQINEAAKKIAKGEFKDRLIITSQDEVGQLSNSFNEMAVALSSLEEMRRDFIANVSHELRTPMTSILGFLNGIIDETIPLNKHKEYLTIVVEEVNRLNRLVTDLLDLAKMEAGQVSLNLKIFDINELIRRCIIKLESIIVEKNIDIETYFDEESIQVYADIDSIERVLTNLLHNAVKFTLENGKIILRTEIVKDKINISIEDDGLGIEKNEIDNIWERFYKSDKARTKVKGGTGLGLAIVKNIINEHKQEIWIESEIQVGSKFTFTLNKNIKEN